MGVNSAIKIIAEKCHEGKKAGCLRTVHVYLTIREGQVINII